MAVDFEWDEAKRLINIRKRRIDFEDVKHAFADPHALPLPAGAGHGEPRFALVGRLGERVITVIYTPRGASVRLISARTARPGERAAYERRIG